MDCIDPPKPAAVGKGPYLLVSSGNGVAARATAARQWLERFAALSLAEAIGLEKGGQPFSAVVLRNLQVNHAGGGSILCSLRVPGPLADGDGRWSAGAIAALMDEVGAAASVEVKISVDFNITYFSPAMMQEEVEIEGRVLHRKICNTACAVLKWTIRSGSVGSPKESRLVSPSGEPFNPDGMVHCNTTLL